MYTFIDHIADYIIREYRDNLDEVKVLFPNHRAVLFLRKRLAEKMEKTYINPEMRSIDALVNDYCDWVVPERISLVYSLYETAQNLEDSDETFAHFYSWGDKILNDFDVLDKNLVDPEKLFKTIDDINELEQNFGHLEEETIALLEEFWGHVNHPKNETDWTDTWEHSGDLYFAFANALKSRNCAYPGMKYRYLAENLELLEDWESSPIIIAGFNRLSKSEEKILNHLNHADFFWDADSYYMQNEHIAGKFMRDNIRRYGNNIEQSNILKESDKNITVLNISKSHTQSQAAMHFMQQNQWSKEKTMILLADESQLLPLLTVIPEDNKGFNISMGWPVSESPIANLIDHILELHLNYENDFEAYPSLKLHDLLKHSYVRKIADRNISSFTAESEWTRLSELESYGKVYEILLKPLERKMDIFERLIIFVEELYRAEENIEREEDEDAVYLKGSGVFLAEVLKYVHQKLVRLKDIFHPISTSVDLSELTYLFRQIFRNTRIPFSGEPLSGMQILGPLEARSLDYDNVIVFNMREGSWPPSFSESTIPYSLKKAYGMPVIDDEIAEYSYYFWSVVARTRNLLLLNPADTSVFDAKAKSRFLLELDTLKDHFNYSEMTVDQELKVSKEQDIVIEKDELIQEKLRRIQSEHLSASSLLNYAQCSLKFYFKNVLGLEESDIFEPELDLAKFGTVFHNTMEQLYKPYEKEMISSEIIEKLKEKKTEVIRENYRDEMKIEDFQFERGQHLFYIEVLEKYVDNILEYDEKRVPFQILECEKFIFPEFVYDKETGETVKIKGFIDRVDKKDDTVYIIDYKTGNVNLSNHAEDVFTEKKVGGKTKHILQVLFYTYLMKEEHENLEPQLFGVRDVIDLDNVDDANLRLKYYRKIYDLDRSLDIVEKGFSEKVKEIFDISVPFRKTDHEDNCKYCDFKFICNR